jgi:hypothetical protein
MSAEAKGRRSRHHAAREAAQKILNDEIYQRNLLMRAQTGDLSPQMEVRLWEHVYGKPVDEVIISKEDDLSDLTEEQLFELATELRDYLKGEQQQDDPTIN